MKRAKLLILTLLAVLGYGTASAEYVADFNSAISTQNHDFAVASNWGHIVGVYEDDWANGYMSYSYSSSEGIGESGTLLAYRQYAQNMYNDGAVCYDLLVTPKVSGTVTLSVKPSLSATAAYPSWVEIYDVNEAGTTRGEFIQKFTKDAGFVADEENVGWYTITLSVDVEKRLGIRAQYVYMDNFTATDATIVPEKKLTINNVADVNGASTTYFDQQADGTILARYLVTLTNSGDVDLNPGDENYTLSLFNRSAPATLYGAFPIPVAIAVGKTCDPFEMQITLPADQAGWKNWDVKENISGTTKEGKWCGTNAYESKFVFDKAGTAYTSSPSPTNKEIAFGMVSESTTVNYEIYNAGTAPLKINSITIDAPFTTNAPVEEFTMEAKEKKPIDITFPATEPGIFNGNIIIEYTDYNKDKATYTLPVTATVLDPSKNLITFDNGKTGDEFNGQFPAGSIHYSQVYISYSGTGDELNYYLQSSNSSSKFVTPLLTAEAGETFSFDSWYNSSWYTSEASVAVYISKDRKDWTQLLKTENNALGSTPKTFFVTIEEAGDIYLAFELYNNALLDNIYGLTLSEQPEHNWIIMKENIPTTGKQNNEYTATISLNNINAEADVVETATLYLDGEAVVTVSNTSLPGNDKTAAEGTGSYYSNMEEPVEISLSFKPHTFGTLPAYIELKSGEAVFATEEVEVTIAQEKTESELAIGDSNTTVSNMPVYGLWGDDNQGLAECDVVYSADMLLAYGLKAGDIISSIKFPGTPLGNRDFRSVTLDAWVGLESAEAAFVPGGAIKDNMQHVVLYNEEAISFKENETIDFIITLPEPIEWDGTSSLRIATNFNGHGNYLNFSFPADNSNGRAYYSHGGGSWSYTTIPVAYLTLDAEETIYGAWVYINPEYTPIEGATVTLYNAENDVQYSGTTDELGLVRIEVVQDKLAYTVTVEAEGFEPLTSEVEFTESIMFQQFGFTPLPTPMEYTFNEKYGWGTFFYSISAYAIPEGVTAYVVSGVEESQVTLTEISAIPSATAVIITGEPGETYTFEPTPEPNLAIGENHLEGTDRDLIIWAEDGEKCYVLSAKNDVVGFYYGDSESGGTFINKAHKAYLRVPASDNPNANGYALFDLTNINTATATSVSSDAPAYNLAGQRVDKAFKGVVIVNGKKMVRK